jgi:hypothetical protein
MEDTPKHQNNDDAPEQREGDDAFDAFYQVGEKLRTPEVQEIIDQLLVTYDPDEEQNPMDVLLQHGKNLLPDEYYAFVEMYLKLHEEFGLNDEAVEMPSAEVSTANRELAAYILEEARALLYASHTFKLLLGGFTDEEKEIINDARATLQQLVGDVDMAGGALEARYDQLERSRAALAATHILDSAAEWEIADNDPSVYDIEELQQAHELNERYRNRHSELYPEAAMRRSLLPTHYWHLEVTDDERLHLERHLRAIDTSKEINRLEIKGLGFLPFSLSSTEVRDFLHDIPGVTFEGVTGIYFQERPPEDRYIKTDESNGRWAILAEHQHDFESNDSRIRIRSDAIAAYFKKRYNEALARGEVSVEGKRIAHDAARVQTIEHVKDTLVHEFGHAFLNRLPVALLNDWDIAVFESLTDQPVSRYVEVADTLSPGSYPIEDFAESFMLCLLHPDQLAGLAPDRLAAMRALIAATRP